MSDYIFQFLNLFARLFSSENGRLRQRQLEAPPPIYATPFSSGTRGNQDSSKKLLSDHGRQNTCLLMQPKEMQNQMSAGRSSSQLSLCRCGFQDIQPETPPKSSCPLPNPTEIISSRSRVNLDSSKKPLFDHGRQHTCLQTQPRKMQNQTSAGQSPSQLCLFRCGFEDTQPETPLKSSCLPPNPTESTSFRSRVNLESSKKVLFDHGMQNMCPLTHPREMQNQMSASRNPSQLSLCRCEFEDTLQETPLKSSCRPPSPTQNTNDGTSKRTYCHFPQETTQISSLINTPKSAEKCSQSALEIYTPAKERQLADTAVKKNSSDTGYCGSSNIPLPAKKKFRFRGHPLKCNWAISKIPIPFRQRCDLQPIPNPEVYQIPPRQCGKYTLPKQIFARNEINDLQSVEDVYAAGDVVYKSADIGNWIAYRNDTSARFENVFKSLSKKKHTIGNVIDSSSHLQWMLRAGISIDKDAYMFKKFAGGKIVLTFGEYKYLIDKICKIHDLDYWDVLRKMATFYDDEINQEGHFSNTLEEQNGGM